MPRRRGEGAMIAETEIITDLKATLAPVPVFYGFAPQPPDNQAVPLPVVIVNRIGSAWPNTFCGVDVALELAQIQVDYYGRSNEVARRLADIGRTVVGGLEQRPGLSSERTEYDDLARAWRVIQQWAVADYAPAIP